jgi:hypothetical protein
MIHSSREGDDRANEFCSSSTISVVTPSGEFLNSPRFRSFPQRASAPFLPMAQRSSAVQALRPRLAAAAGEPFKSGLLA